ncbi:MAG: HEAT repeat domain-containing protein [Acidobacteria bacterium]|nr:HEAT repeat domain-containing protein [Acidobacteriota bacterium]
MRLQLLFPLLLLSFAAQSAAAPPQVANARLETASAGGGLEAAVRQAGASAREPFWIAWSVPMIAGQRYNCCFNNAGKGEKWTRTTCHLEGKDQGWGSTDDAKVLADQDLLVLTRIAGGQIEKVRSFSANCPLDAGDRRFIWLGDAKPEESVALLAKTANPARAASRNLAEEALAALSFHRSSRADEVLEDLAAAPHSRKVREDALFWLGQSRGERGARFITRVMEGDSDVEIRKKAIFALSQSKAAGVTDSLIRLSRQDRSADVRGEGLFWLAQRDDPKAPDAIVQAIETDPDLAVKKKGVFALSQLRGGRGVPLLIEVGRKTREREVRKEALFWLTQSNDPAAFEYVEKALNQ